MKKYRWLFCHRIKEVGNSLIFPEIGSKKKIMLQKEIKRTKAEIRERIDQKKKNCQNESHNQKQQKILGNN